MRRDARAVCAYCGEPVDGRHREVTCWESLRSAGGANKMTARQPTGRYACAACFALLARGIPPNTERLFT